MRDIIVPKLNNNDETCKLRSWTKAPGDQVREGEVIAILEDSKATFDLEAEQAGTLRILVEAGSTCTFGARIGALLEEGEGSELQPAAAPLDAEPLVGVTVTKGARDLIDLHGIPPARLAALGLKVLRRADVEALLAPSTAAVDEGFMTPTRRQLAVAAVVTRSHHEIPRAFSVMKAHVTPALVALKARSDRGGVVIGLPELVVRALALLAPKFPWFFGRVSSTASLVHAPRPDVGVTIDVGKGLFIPVLRDPAGMSLEDLAKRFMEFKMKGLRDAFRSEDLAGGDVTLSLALEGDVVFTLPIILPEQPCMVTLGSVLREVDLDVEGRPFVKEVINLGVAYDHRLVNGADAMALLRGLQKTLESGELP